MGLLLSINHLLNFAAPAVVLALLMPLWGRWMGAGAIRPHGYLRQCAVHAGLGVAVLLAGLWFGGRDAMMLTYGALVLVAGTAQWGMRGLR